MRYLLTNLYQANSTNINSSNEAVRIVISLVILISPSGYATPPIDHVENTFLEIGYYSNDSDLMVKANLLYTQQKYSEAISLYALVLKQQPADAAGILMKMAQSHSTLGNVASSINYIEQSLLAEFDTHIINHNGFDTIRDTANFRNLEDKYSPKFN